MPEHKLEPGRLWIENLLALGDALDYTSEPEFDVAPEPDRESPVDVAWLRWSDDPVPLFIFEVESVAGSQMSHNAGKVLAQDTNLFEKPLFLFHIVVTGGEESTRPEVAQRMFGHANYRVYLAAQARQTTQMICDVLSQHRRVCRDLEPDRLIEALTRRELPDLDLHLVLEHAESCRFRAPWAKAYASLAMNDERMLRPLARVLYSDLEREVVPGEQYCTWLADYYSRALHLAILACLCPELAGAAFAALRDWQERPLLTPIAPMLGLKEEYDNFVFGWTPHLWALIAALLRDVQDAQAWVLSQMARNLGSVENPFPFELGALAAVWMLHLARAAGDASAYTLARDYLNASGGISPAIVAAPPARAETIGDLDAWGQRLRDDAREVPALVDLPAAGSRSVGKLELVRLALAQLLFQVPPDRAARVIDAL